MILFFTYPTRTVCRAAGPSAIHPAADEPPRRPSRLSDKRGFTLIEMVVVTALISIMLVVAIPRLHSNIFPDSGGETARWIIANTRKARETAVEQQKTILLNVALDTQRMWIAPADLAETDAASARDKGYRLPRGVTIDHVAFSKTDRLSSGIVAIGFYPQGHSDHAVVRIRTNDGDRMAAHIEPFLPNVKLIRGGERW